MSKTGKPEDGITPTLCVKGNRKCSHHIECVKARGKGLNKGKPTQSVPSVANVISEIGKPNDNIAYKNKTCITKNAYTKIYKTKQLRQIKNNI